MKIEGAFAVGIFSATPERFAFARSFLSSSGYHLAAARRAFDMFGRSTDIFDAVLIERLNLQGISVSVEASVFAIILIIDVIERRILTDDYEVVFAMATGFACR